MTESHLLNPYGVPCEQYLRVKQITRKGRGSVVQLSEKLSCSENSECLIERSELNSTMRALVSRGRELSKSKKTRH